MGASLMCMVRHGMLSERVRSMHAHEHYVCASLVQNAVCTRCALCRSVKKVCVKWPARKLMYMKAKDGDTDKEAEVWRGSLVSLSFQPCSSLRGCLSFLLSHCRRSRSYSYHHYTLHLSLPHTHTSASVAWPYMVCQCGHVQPRVPNKLLVQRIRITWMGDRHRWSVGWCTCSHRPR